MGERERANQLPGAERNKKSPLRTPASVEVHRWEEPERIGMSR